MKQQAAFAHQQQQQQLGFTASGYRSRIAAGTSQP